MRPATSRGRQVRASPGRCLSPSLPSYSDLVLRCPGWAGEITSSMVHYSPSRGGEPPAPSVGTGPEALFSGTCCGSQIETALRPAAGGGRAGGRCRSPALPLLLPGGRLRRSREMPQKRGASRRGSALLRSALARGAGSGGCPPRATAHRPPKPSLGTPPRACRRADPSAPDC